MKIRESGMPERDMWENFFDPVKTLVALGINSQTGDVAEFGCGYGTFTIPAAKVIKGKIYALDIEPDMIRITEEEAKKNGLNNVQTILRDFMVKGSGLPDGSIDYVMLFNILHFEKPMILINEAKRILGAEGKLGIIHSNNVRVKRGGQIYLLIYQRVTRFIAKNDRTKRTLLRSKLFSFELRRAGILVRSNLEISSVKFQDGHS